LEDRHERTVFGSHENALLPIIAQALNKFEQNKKNEILKSLTQSDSFTKCLKLLEFLSSDADINFIKEQIKSFDVSSYLDEKSYIPEIETVVIKLSEFEEFIEKAKEALTYWEKRILTQRDNTEYLIIYFRIKLLIAYYEGDEQAILNEQPPPVDSFSTSNGFEFKPAETRNFYLGLVKLKNNEPEKAYEIFSRLINTSKNDKSSIAINRFYTHIKLAKLKANKEEKEKSLTEALTEWDSYENSIPEKNRTIMLEYVQENIWLNKLNVYHKLQRYTEFDKLFSAIDKAYQLRKDFFEIRINNYVKRGLYEIAKSFVIEAKTYHQSKDEILPEFIRLANEKLEDEEDYKRLRKEYYDLISKTPEKLMQILPENIVGKRNIQDYILKEICGSANDVLDNINAIAEIDTEDKYSDLLILSLQSKFRNWHWKIGNTRGGFSASNKRNLGELDFVITAADNDRIASCEALLLHGKNTSTVTTHTIKTFNYDHRRKLFFIISYYDGKSSGNHWDDYKTKIVPTIKYPDGFPLSENVEEITESFTNDSVRALLAKHGEDTRVYHVFININYKV
jgi:tetratricopeptide (TPR) repeat protein